LTILGLPEDETDDLFEEVVAHTLRPEFCFDHSWTENDLVLWAAESKHIQHLARRSCNAAQPALATHTPHRA
jgi:taurine dioxygenase